MVNDRKATAIKLRRCGYSIKHIAKELQAAQSSVSIWTRSVRLTQQQIEMLRANTHSPQTIEKRRQSRLKSEAAKRNFIIRGAKSTVSTISKRELWLMGISLYWAEGGKTQSVVRFSNGDPRMIRLMLRFFREVCMVDEAKIKGHIHIHESLNVKVAEQYWQQLTGIPPERFYKTYNKPNKSSKGTRNSLPFGVFDIYIMNANLLLKIKGWIEGAYSNAIKVADYQQVQPEPAAAVCQLL
jgi:hypothetical protein